MSAKRIDDIQVLRGVGILMVLVEHWQHNLIYWDSRFGVLANLFWHGAAGVDLFFVISGFVIARSLLGRLQAAAGLTYLAETLTFLLHRFWRLQPAAWLWLIIPTVLSLVFNQTTAFHGLVANCAAALTAVLGVYNLRSAMIFGHSDLGFASPYWSLSLEEQFYLLLPVLAFVFRRRLVWVMGALILYQFMAPAGPLFTATRPGAIAMGVLLAIFSHKPGYALAEPRFLAGRWVWRAAFLGGGVLVLGSLQSSLAQPLGSVPLGLTAVVAGMLVYAASFDRGYTMRAGVLKRVFVYIGARSYALYLTHIPAYAFALELFYRLRLYDGHHDWREIGFYALVIPPVLLTVAELTYRYVETPARRYGRTLRIAAPTEGKPLALAAE